MSQITTLTFFRYKRFSDKLWALKMMQFAHIKLQKVKSQEFYKLMGSGKGDGFNPYPDWEVYSLLQVWKNEEAADDFFQNSPVLNGFRKHSSEIWTLYLKNIRAVGVWSGKNPFTPSENIDPENPYLAVVTRATIKTRKLIKFWRYVPVSQAKLKKNEGLIYTKGIGEVPLVQMATFSLWKSEEAMKQYAYSAKGHQGAIKRTRQLKWYKEELFSRFQPYRSVGTWNGKDPLPEL